LIDFGSCYPAEKLEVQGVLANPEYFSINDVYQTIWENHISLPYNPTLRYVILNTNTSAPDNFISSISFNK
jgi:hypothetical protein